MKLGRDTGSVFNHLLSADRTGVVPEVGVGVTILLWTDRHAGTIIYVSKNRAKVVVRQDKATRTDTGMSENQEYTYEADPDGKEYAFFYGKRGYRCDGAGLLVGERDEYYDFSF